ncbi:hypothetical protein AtubIFM55763_004680 [Aspergillus tubingensis]|nr:hypothetical protein AtubIFM55763_004680 [Aspergillus tubingensis]
MPKFNGHHEHVHPPAFQEELRRIKTFQRIHKTQSWYLIQSLIEEDVQKYHRIIIQLLSILEHALELPPLTLQQKCQYEQLSQDRLHYMHYAPRTAEEHKKTAHVYSAGHTDLGLFTLLFRQPVASLQILDAQGEWRWVQTRDNALTVNIGDTLSLLSCQHFKSTVHRVHSPPADQAHLERLTVLYFGKFNDNVYLDPLTNSPVLQRSTSLQNDFTKAGIRMTMGEYSLARQTQNSRCKQPLTVHADGRFEWDPKDLEAKGGLKVTYYD